MIWTHGSVAATHPILSVTGSFFASVVAASLSLAAVSFAYVFGSSFVDSFAVSEPEHAARLSTIIPLRSSDIIFFILSSLPLSVIFIYISIKDV